jgi:hypothetical protein
MPDSFVQTQLETPLFQHEQTATHRKKQRERDVNTMSQESENHVEYSVLVESSCMNSLIKQPKT